MLRVFPGVFIKLFGIRISIHGGLGRIAVFPGPETHCYSMHAKNIGRGMPSQSRCSWPKNIFSFNSAQIAFSVAIILAAEYGFLGRFYRMVMRGNFNE